MANSTAKSADPSPLLEPTWLGRLAPAQLFSLANRPAVITGAAGGVGRWLAAGFGLAGARMLLTDRDEAALRGLVAELQGQGIEAESLPCDLDDTSAARRITEAAVARLGGLHVLVNNAGINRRLPMLDVDPDVHAEIWRVDYTRCFELAQAAARVMVKQGGGSIIHIGSINSLVGLEDVSMLGPTKAALSQLAKAMTVELAHLGVRTNVLAPGFLDTPMNAGHWDDPTRAPWIMDRTPMQRPGHPAELVGTALLLASAAGSFISGQTIYVDGGISAGSRWNVPPGSGLEAFRAWVVAGRPVREFEP
jgi:NAD(P)-dependent dehydrogenase (short-subunit alcohol dehydrogenase family)